jgi:GT2 family glycosyltransferase
MQKNSNYQQKEDLESRIHELERELKLANDELWRVKQLNQAMENTISWKVTSPLRFARSIPSRLRKTAFGRAIYKLKLARSNLYQALQQSKGNSLALDRLVNSRADELFSKHHIGHNERKNKPFHKNDLPFIDLSVVTYNNGKWADQFFQTLKQQNYPLAKINLIFVDNSSTDNTYQKLDKLLNESKRLFASVTLKLEPNIGFGGGHNSAIIDSHSEFILISNIDVEFRQDTIVNLVSEAVIDSHDVACWEVRQAPYEHPKYIDPVTLQVNWSSHCAVLLRRAAYQAVGGYDPSIFMYGEDVELSYRFISRGWKLRYVPDAVLVHHTYKEVNEIKPVQFVGSIYANGLIRIRYGSFRDVIAALLLQIGVLTSQLPIDKVKRKLLKNFFRLLTSIPRERLKRIPLRGTFPFRGFDYDMRREGAFYDILDTKDSGPLVSVITRTYKGREHYLKECIASVINQTYKNIEHIIVEDGGDTHKALVEKIQDSYSDSSLFYFSQEKLGRSAAGNKGLAKAQGKWCIFLDDDDLFLPDHVEILANELIKNDELSAAYALAWEVKTDATSSGYSEKFYLTAPVFYQEYSQETLMHHNYIPIQCILFDRNLFLDRGGFDESLDQLEDWNLWVKYSINNKFKWVCKTTSLYRTPYSTNIATERKKLLDGAYKSVQAKNHEVYAIYNVKV